MKEKLENARRSCGNCTSHNAYDYPGQVFCSRRFLKNKDALVQTLWCCEEWHPSAQKCNCVEEATNRER